MGWRITEASLEHRNEVAGGGIAQGISHMGNRNAIGKHFQRMRQPGLLAPLREAAACLGQE